MAFKLYPTLISNKVGVVSHKQIRCDDLMSLERLTVHQPPKEDGKQPRLGLRLAPDI